MFSISKILPNLFMSNSFKVLFGCRFISKIDKTTITTTFLSKHEEICKRLKEQTNKSISIIKHVDFFVKPLILNFGFSKIF